MNAQSQKKPPPLAFIKSPGLNTPENRVKILWWGILAYLYVLAESLDIFG